MILQSLRLTQIIDTTSTSWGGGGGGVEREREGNGNFQLLIQYFSKPANQLTARLFKLMPGVHFVWSSFAPLWPENLKTEP